MATMISEVYDAFSRRRRTGGEGAQGRGGDLELRPAFRQGRAGNSEGAGGANTAQMDGRLCDCPGCCHSHPRVLPMSAGRQNCFARVESDLAVLKWMTGTTLAGVVALVIKRFFV